MTLNSNNMKKLILTIPFLFILAALSSAEEQCFPGQKEIKSPTGKFALVTKGDGYEIYLGKDSGDEPRKIMEFERSVCALWSPDEKYLAVTNYVGSNVSEVLIFDTGMPDNSLNVYDIIPPGVQKLTSDSINSYLEAVRWNKNELVVKASGMRTNAPREFDVLFACVISGGEWTCVDKTEKE